MGIVEGSKEQTFAQETHFLGRPFFLLHLECNLQLAFWPKHKKRDEKLMDYS